MLERINWATRQQEGLSDVALYMLIEEFDAKSVQKLVYFNYKQDIRS